MKFTFLEILILIFYQMEILFLKKKTNLIKLSTTPLLNKYKEFCQSFSLKEIIKEPTRITCSTSSLLCLLDQILTNASEKISQKGIINTGLSDHQLIYCTRKILKSKLNKHNQIQVRSLKNYCVHECFGKH